MAKLHSVPVSCSICKQSKPRGEFAAGETLRDAVVAELRRIHADWAPDQPICYACVNRFRAEHFRRLLEEERGELSSLEEQVINSLREQEALSENVNLQFERQLSFGERLSDRLAAFGGSWSFLILFAVVVIAWMIGNGIFLAQRPFDPYPFILLNLVLSCLAAIQAPVILMSQNRQEAKDRLRSEHDYRVDLKAELEVRLLHTKMDQLLTHQWQRLLEIQELQMEILEDVANRKTGRTPSPKPRDAE
ncbi:MAG TPA: DUF1003 domain-containing protein [Pirellulaceae bacterium]|nr:DUF1003 domain-containing protein [Pirellulaceae bacterium]